MLRIENLHVEYAGIPALRGIDIDIRPGEIVALIGPRIGVAGTNEPGKILITRAHGVAAGRVAETVEMPV